MKNEQIIENVMDKYLEGNKSGINEEQGLTLVGTIRSHLSNVKYPSDLIILGGLLCLVGGSLVSQKKGLKTTVFSVVRSLLGKL